MGGIELILIVLADPPTVRLLTATTAPPFSAGIVNVASLMLKLRIGKASVPTVLETTSVLLGLKELRLMVLTPPPATMVLAWTLPPLTLSIPVTGPEGLFVRPRRNWVFTLTIAPEANDALLLTLTVPVEAPVATAVFAFPQPISKLLTSNVPAPSVRVAVQPPTPA